MQFPLAKNIKQPVNEDRQCQQGNIEYRNEVAKRDESDRSQHCRDAKRQEDRIEEDEVKCGNSAAMRASTGVPDDAHFQEESGREHQRHNQADPEHYGRSPNGRFLRHRFSLKPEVIATRKSLPKRNHVAKEAVSAALPTNARQRSERICKPNDAPRTKPRPCVKTMLCDPEAALRFAIREIQHGIRKRKDRLCGCKFNRVVVNTECLHLWV